MLCVDDMLLASKDMNEINMLKQQLSEEIEMKDMGAASKILGIDIQRNKEERKMILVSRRLHKQILCKFEC